MVVLLLVFVACMPAAVLLTARHSRARRLSAVPAQAIAIALPQGVVRRAAGWRWAGLLAGLVTGGAAAASGALGRGLLLAAPLFALCVLAGVIVGETTIRSPGGRTRIAALEVRRVRDYLPRRLTTAVIAATALLVALLAVTTATGSADDLGRSGRVVLLQCSTILQQSAGPWPGSYYSLPLGTMVMAGLLTAIAALRFVVRRPRAGAGPAAAADDTLRQRAGRAISGACGILVALPLAGCSLVSGLALLSLSCRPALLTLAAWTILALVPAAVALVGWSTTVLLVA